MKIRPRNEHVVVRLISAREARGGIVIPGAENEQSIMQVVAVGPGGISSTGQRNPIEVESGVPLEPNMIVFIRGGEYEQFEDEGVPHMIIPQSMILGVEVDESNTPKIMNLN